MAQRAPNAISPALPATCVICLPLDGRGISLAVVAFLFGDPFFSTFGHQRKSATIRDDLIVTKEGANDIYKGETWRMQMK